MTPPINIDGSDVAGATIDGQTVQEITVDGETVFTAIPDSLVSRPEDNDSSSDDRKFGVQIETTLNWPKIGARISANTSGFTTAYVHRISDGQLLGKTDISTLSAGDTFTVDLDTNLVSGEAYNFVIDADGASYTVGLFNSPSFPYTSSDGDLSIVNGGFSSTKNTSGNNVRCLSEIGNIGF